MAHVATEFSDVAGSPDARTDLRQRGIIDAAIALQSRSSTMSALEYLRGYGVGTGVIARVLLEPQRRRRLDVS